MTTMLYKLEEAIDALEAAKNASQNKDVISKLEEGVKDLDRRYGLLERKLALQRDYMLPMFQTLMSYRPPARTGGPVELQP